MSDTIKKSTNIRSVMIGVITILLLISISLGCLQKNTDISKANVSKIIKEDREPEKTVPIEYYVEVHLSDAYPRYSNFSYGLLSWRSKFNITEEDGNEIVAPCIKAFEENAERLAREVPTKIPENWVRDEVRLKKEDFFMGNLPGLKKVDNKVVLLSSKILVDIDNVNYSAFNQSLLSIRQYNQCVYDLKEKKVEKIMITIYPELDILFD